MDLPERARCDDKNQKGKSNEFSIMSLLSVKMYCLLWRNVRFGNIDSATMNLVARNVEVREKNSELAVSRRDNRRISEKINLLRYV